MRVLNVSSQRNVAIEPTQGNEKWKVGPGHIDMENLLLVGIEQVSKAGVQPILVYREMLM